MRRVVAAVVMVGICWMCGWGRAWCEYRARCHDVELARREVTTCTQELHNLNELVARWRSGGLTVERVLRENLLTSRDDEYLFYLLDDPNATEGCDEGAGETCTV